MQQAHRPPQGFVRLRGECGTHGGLGVMDTPGDNPHPMAENDQLPGKVEPPPTALASPMLRGISAQRSSLCSIPSLRVCSQPQIGAPREPPAPLSVPVWI